jgi:hypothetical protein
MNDEARDIIAKLGLEPLPQEGGWFRSTWRTAEGSAIYFLITEKDFSALHRLTTTEVWHFYAGDPVEHTMLDQRDGAVRVAWMSGDVGGPDVAQIVVPGGVWQGARLAAGVTRGWALLGCTMAPAWTEQGFELGQKAELQRLFPTAAEQIAALTR